MNLCLWYNLTPMCRNIKRIYNVSPKATKEEINDASLQFVRKVSGYRHPSKINEKAFEEAIRQISKDVEVLLSSLTTNVEPKVREIHHHSH